MGFTFKISEEQYLSTLRMFLRLKRRGIPNILILFFMTVGQAGLVAWNIVRLDIQGTPRVMLIVLSALICLLQAFYQTSIGLRARIQLKKSMASGKISKDFWNMQNLTIKDDVLTLRCGKSRLTYDCAYYRGAWRVGDMLLLDFKRGEDVHQLFVPASVFDNMGGTEGIEKYLAEAKRNSILAGFAGNGWKRPEQAKCSVEYSYTKKNFARDYVRSARLGYLTRIPWSIGSIAKIAGAAFLMYNVIAGNFDSTAFVWFAVLASILLLYRYIATYTPLIRLMAKKNTESIFAGLDVIRCAVDITDDELVFSGDTFYNAVRLSSVCEVKEKEDMAAIYLKDSTAITIAIDSENRSDAARCLEQLASLHRISG